MLILCDKVLRCALYLKMKCRQPFKKSVLNLTCICFIEGSDAKKAKLFGESIKFSQPDQNQSKEDDIKDYSWLDFDEHQPTKSAADFSMKFFDGISEQDGSDTAHAAAAGTRMDGSWLRKEVERHCDQSSSGMSVTDMASTIFDILTSSKTDEQLQNDVRMKHWHHFDKRNRFKNKKQN